MAHRRTALKCTSCDKPTAGDTGALCWDCTKAGARDLASWALWDRNLQITRTRRDRIHRGDDNARAARAFDEAPLPVNLRAADIAGRARRILTDWHRRLRAAIPLDHTRPAWPVCAAAATTWCTHASCRRIILDHGNAPATVPDMALALAAASTWWRHEADAADLIHAAHRAVHDIRAACDIPPPMITLGRCDTTYDDAGQPCGAELRAPKGEAFMNCPKCRASYDVERRRARLLDRIEGHVLPAPVVAGIISAWMGVDVPLSTFRTWKDRNQLESHGIDRETRANRYRIGDVRRCVLRDLNEEAKQAAALIEAAEHTKAIAASQHTNTREILAA